uniref:Uncharacterized protein n=1 Tax=Tanacetum cinerariifolium TaxID=118510 RepID=A0A699IT92_TANCI|nr:hypothetical protein [Tanacetum cinerariifolium]
MLKYAERVKNDVSKKKKDSLETKQDWLSIRARGSPKVLYNLMMNLSPAQMKDIIDIGFGSMIGIASEEIPGKIAHFVVDNFDDDSMKLKLSNGVISITPELVYKVLRVPLGGEDINRMNRLGSEDVTTLEWHSQFSRKNPTSKKVYDKIQESRMDGILFKLNFLVLFLNAMGLSEKGGQYDSSDDDIFVREKVTLLKLIVEDLEFEFSNSLVDHPNSSRLKDIKAKYNRIIRNTNLSDFSYAIEDNSIHHESQYGNVFSETDYSLNFNDISRNYNVRECSHGVEELDKYFINETNEENGEDSSEEEMIEEKNEMIIINKDEDEFNVFNGKKETSFDFNMFDIPKVDDKEKSVVGGFEDCLMKGLFKQVAEPNNYVRSFGNSFRVSTSDMPKHRLDEPPSFSRGHEFNDSSIEEINQTNSLIVHKKKNRVWIEFKQFFRAESEIDVLKEDIKPDIKDASIRVQSKREPSIAWYLKSTFKVRGSALNTYANTLSQTEVLTSDTLFIMDEETYPM